MLDSLSSATQEILRTDPDLSVQVYDRGYHQFVHSRFGVVGVDPEEGDFLHGLVRLIKADTVVELGTNVGISTRYILLALGQDGAFGRLFTAEWDLTVLHEARKKVAGLGKYHAVIEFSHGDVSKLVFSHSIDLLFLDTELATRYSEMTLFFNQVTVGGFIVVHDMPRIDTKEFGPIPGWLLRARDEHLVSEVVFNSVHGMTVFQKRGEVRIA